MRSVKFWALGCYPLSAGEETDAVEVAMVPSQTTTIKVSERGGPVINSDQTGSIERTKEGYF